MKIEQFNQKEEIIVAGPVILENKKLLVIMDDQGYYKTPGGKKEGNESHEETIKRESLEEIGAEVDIGELVKEHFIEEKEKKYRLFNYRASLKTLPKLTPEISKFRWISYQDSKELKLSPNVQTLVDFLRTKGEM